MEGSNKRSVEQLYAEVKKQQEVIPPDVTAYFLRRNGFECPDPVVIKMISLAAQKFLTDLAKESYTYSKQRQAVSQPQQKNKRNVLLLDDVSRAASKFGISMNKLEYVADSVSAGTTLEMQPQQQQQQQQQQAGYPQYQQQQAGGAGQGGAADKKGGQSRPKKKSKV